MSQASKLVATCQSYSSHSFFKTPPPFFISDMDYERYGGGHAFKSGSEPRGYTSVSIVFFMYMCESALPLRWEGQSSGTSTMRISCLGFRSQLGCTVLFYVAPVIQGWLLCHDIALAAGLAKKHQLPLFSKLCCMKEYKFRITPAALYII